MITGNQGMYKHVILPEEMVTTDNLQKLLALNRNVRYLGGTSPSLVAVSRAGFSPAKRTLYSAQRLYATEWLQVQHFRTYNHEGIAFFDK